MAKKNVPKKPAKKKSNKQPAPRKLAPTKYQSFRLQKRIQYQGPKLKSAFGIFKDASIVLRDNRKLFGGILVIYAILNLVLVKGFGSGLDITELRTTAEEILGGQLNDIGFGLTVFAVLVGSASQPPSDLASGYQSVLLVITSLALIWTLRQRFAGEAITIRDAFYKSMYPLIPFILVLLVVGLQLSLLAIVSVFYQWIFTGVNVVSSIEQVVWAVLLLCLVVLSLYMVTSSIFALYIATLPNMRPMKALRSARELVRYRRPSVMLKLLFLPLIVFVLGAIITVPVILYMPVIATWLFFALTVLGLALAHSYMYTLYRELL